MAVEPVDIEAADRAAGPAKDPDPLPPSSAAEDSILPPPQSTGSFAWRLLGVLQTIRPHQWVKNVFVLAPVVFAKEIFSPDLLRSAASAFIVFCLLAGAVYAMNDIADVEADRQHPLKRYRPIASGRVPVAWARLLVVGLVVASALLGGLFIGTAFLVTAGLYFALNIAYSLKLKHTAYLDVGCISAGFVLRVVAGGFAANIALSNYLLLCTALLAFFLGFGKRRHELAAKKGKKQRAALESYTARGLDIALATTGLATVAAYFAYTRDPHTIAFFHSDQLWFSTIFVILGGMRFLTIVRGRPHAESPTQEMLRDGPFVAIVLFWVVLVMWMVYQLRPS